MLRACNQGGLCGSKGNGELETALERALRRILSWQIPPNWSAYDWSHEVKAIAVAAGCQAALEYDSKRGVPLSAFLYQRALTCGWTRYRQEWAYAVRFSEANANERDMADLSYPSLLDNCLPDSLHWALTELQFADQWLIRQLFWNNVSEDKLARNLRITQQAVSKRKQKIICRLRRLLNDARAAILLSSALVWSAVTDSIEPLLWCDLWL